MPTYTFRCANCGEQDALFMSIRAYSSGDYTRPQCCAADMERTITVAPGFSGLANALAGDRHYEGLRAPDGTDIGSRTKHREYMKRTGLTTADDFKGTWKEAEKRRTALRTASFQDKELRSTLTEQVMRAVAE